MDTDEEAKKWRGSNLIKISEFKLIMVLTRPHIRPSILSGMHFAKANSAGGTRKATTRGANSA
jgi:hypothetical protein